MNNIDNKIIEFITELKQSNHPLIDLMQLKDKLKNDTLYCDILELAVAHLVTLKK
jgi:hypothetical protein